MGAAAIRTLKPNVTQKEAVRAFSAPGFSALYWRMRVGLDGSLDLFEFPRIPEQHELVSVDSRNRMVPSLTAERAEEILREKVLRVIFQQGFFKLRKARLEMAREPGEMYLPYWLGFYGGSGSVRCRVMDAVRRRIEGAKASAFFEQWLAA